MASAPFSTAEWIVPFSGSHSSGRPRRTTSCPLFVSNGISAEPTSPVEPVMAIFMKKIIRGVGERAALRLLLSKSFQCVMVLIILAGVVEVGLADSGMAVHTLPIFFLGVLGGPGRKWHKEQSHQAGYP